MIRAIIFDLGNVLLHFDHRIILDRLGKIASLEAYAGASRDIEALSENFERGEIATETFVSRFLALLAVEGPFDAERFAELWSDIFWKNEALFSLLGTLCTGIPLYMLSNTNPLHIRFARERYPEVFGAFTGCLFSFEAGFLKPEPEAFALAARRAGVEKDECLYFDDMRANVDAAESAGLHAYQYVSVDSARDILAAYELLEPAQSRAA